MYHSIKISWFNHPICVVFSFGFYESASANDSIAIRDHTRTCTLSGVTRKRIGGQPKIRTCKILHLKDPVLKITILSTWTDQSEVRNRPRGTSYLIVCRAIRFPYHAIRPPKLPHVSFSVGWRLEAAPGEFGRKPFLSTHNASSSSSQHAYVRGAIHCTTSLLCFLVAKKLTEAADALYGTLLHMFVFSQWWG